MTEKTPPVHVEIFGQTYAVQAGAETGYVEQLAAFVDAQMREVSRGAGAVDSDGKLLEYDINKVAVMRIMMVNAK